MHLKETMYKNCAEILHTDNATAEAN